MAKAKAVRGARRVKGTFCVSVGGKKVCRKGKLSSAEEAKVLREVSAAMDRVTSGSFQIGKKRR
jgi:hypothetical protein